MKRKIAIIFLSIVLILVISGCATYYTFSFEPNEMPQNEMKLFMPSAYSYLQITIYFNTERPITDFQYIEGYVQIGEKRIDFERDLILILGKERETNFNIVMFEKGNERSLKDESNLSRKDRYFNKNNDFNYFFQFIQFFEEEAQNEIIKNNYNIARVYLNYRMTIDDKAIHILLNEDFSLKIEKHTVSIFRVLFHE
ncbi:MAG: hypothetical protein LBQ93_01200 [Treponema sp.]|jgi:hypothetical protein|nr:hypothetical protein [Treponema sp.]